MFRSDYIDCRLITLQLGADVIFIVGEECSRIASKWTDATREKDAIVVAPIDVQPDGYGVELDSYMKHSHCSI